jgi:hypothetical protein
MNDLEKLERLLDLLELGLLHLKHPDPMHTHQCGSCKQMWDHPNSSAGDVNAHICPHCAAGPWWERV